MYAINVRNETGKPHPNFVRFEKYEVLAFELSWSAVWLLDDHDIGQAIPRIRCCIPRHQFEELDQTPKPEPEVQKETPPENSVKKRLAAIEKEA